MTSPGGGNPDFGRKRSLIRPERNRIDPDHPNYHYRKHAQKMEVFPSTTGNDPIVEDHVESRTVSSGSTATKAEQTLRDIPYVQDEPQARKPGKIEPAGRKRTQKRLTRKENKEMSLEEKRRQKELDAIRPPSLWNVYCAIVTFWCPDFVLKCFGKPAKAQRRAWREKMGLLSIILLICAFVGFLTFGFTQAVCGAPGLRLKVNKVDSGYMILHGSAYDLSRSQHPAARGITLNANVLYDLPHKYGGQDGSFFFQNVNGACKGLISRAPESDVPTNEDGDLAWYFPCTAFNQDGSSKPNLTIPYYLGYGCHTTGKARDMFYGLRSSGEVYFTWEDIRNSSRNLMVYSGSVLDLDLLHWFNKSQVAYPTQFDELQQNPATKVVDITQMSD
jgi:chitin synthase